MATALTPKVSRTTTNGTTARQVPLQPEISRTLLQTSPKKAREILTKYSFPDQRRVRPHHVAYLQDVITRGHLRPGTCITFAILGTQKFLVNGTHTLTALGKTTGGPLWLQFEEYKVESYAEVGQLYETFDRGLQRSWRDLYPTNPSLQQTELKPKHLNLLGYTTLYFATGFEPNLGEGRQLTRYQPVRDARIRMQLMEDWAPEMHNFLAGAHGHRSVRQLLEKAPVLAVALVTYRYQPAASHRFWPRLAGDSGLEVGEPEHTLLRFLRERTVRSMDPMLYVRYVASAWTYFFNGKTARQLTPRKLGEAIHIAGTPHSTETPLGYLTPAGEVVHTPVPVRSETC